VNYEDYYTWQRDVPGFGSESQEKLRSSTALVSRGGGQRQEWGESFLRMEES
jgi:hypothetical protein